MCATTGEYCSKASTLFEAINGTLTKDGLDWDNIYFYNANENIGNKNFIKSKILEKNASCFIAGCNCHLSHLVAGRGGSAYSALSGFDCQDHTKSISTISSAAARGVKVYSQNVLNLLD